MEYLNKLNLLAKKCIKSPKPGLLHLKKMLRALGSPETKFPIIHVAGTNGKGSTAAMLNAILVRAGYRVGFYTSPHFLDYRERIRINHNLISAHDLNSILALIFGVSFVAKLTYFEVLTAAAFKYFAEKQVDFVICEVGLGGRFDATNAAKNKLLSIITSIDADHTEILGNNISSIASEKAGIIARKIPTIVYTGHRVADAVMVSRAKALQSPLYFLGRDFLVKDEGIDWRPRSHVQFLNYRGINCEYRNIRLNLLGEHQVRNAGICLAAVEILQGQYAIPDYAILNGLQSVFWPGRFEEIAVSLKRRCQIPLKINVILDGAHNAAGAKALSNLLTASHYAKHLTLVMSMLFNKDYRNVCKILSKVAGKVIIFRASHPCALEPKKLAQEWKKYLSCSKIFIIEDFLQLFALLKQKPLIGESFCVTGSLYAVADALAAFDATGKGLNKLHSCKLK